MITGHEFAQRVAERCERPVDDILPILRGRGITLEGTPPTPRRLAVTEIAFSGAKTINGSVTPFEFRWSGLAPGFWAIASDANLRGKSSILEVMLWCLRGKPRALQDAVRSWIRRVTLAFALDGVPHRIEFQIEGGNPVGSLSRPSHGATQAVELRRFTTEAEFEALMDEFMMSAFDLVRLRSRQKYAGDTLAQTVSSGWLGYSKGLLIAGSDPVLLGDEVHAGLPGRLLQMYLGIPYAELAMAALAAAGEERQAEQQSQRRADLDRDMDGNEIAALRLELETARQRLAEAETVGDVVAEAVTQGNIVADIIGQRTAMLHSIGELDLRARAAERAANDEEASVTDMEHALKARRYFTGLQPVCCPRCQRPIESKRRELEADEGRCSVCATPREQEDEAAFLAALEEAQAHAREARQTAIAAREAHAAAVTGLARIDANLTAARAKLADIERRRGLGDARQTAMLAVAHLEGRLSEREARAAERQQLHQAEPLRRSCAGTRNAFRAALDPEVAELRRAGISALGRGEARAHEHQGSG